MDGNDVHREPLHANGEVLGGVTQGIYEVGESVHEKPKVHQNGWEEVKHPPFQPFFKWVIRELEKEEEMLQLFFTVAFSTVPLTLYVPPIRSLNLFVETMEYVVRESTSYRNRVYPRLRLAWSRMLDFMLCNNNMR
ncbi:hypothetical protein V8G54_023200 [Vigna mungo]|uniref:Uncharacterized protein n=1 Tax=Vigna mungo TaxID=3915 RepID=A0AAQ3RNZ3_VIGMU